MYYYKNADNNHFDLFIVGNGFDKKCGLPTGYSDFYEALKLVEKNAGNFDSFFKDYKNPNRKASFDFFQLARTSLISNYFVRYSLAYDKAFKKWCEFETELEKLLVTFDYVLSNLHPTISKNVFEANLTDKNLLLHIFSPNFVPVWRDFAFRSYDDYESGSIIDKSYQGGWDKASLVRRINEIRSLIADGLYDDLERFKQIFVLYLISVANKKDKTIKNAFIDRVITFNYTSTIENCTLPTEILHIHGSLESEIVLGINSLVTFKDKRFNKFKKSSQKSTVQNDISLSKIIDGAEMVGYFGLSFDSNDKDTFGYIFDNLKDAKHIVFYLPGEKENVVTNIQEIIGNNAFNELKNDERIEFVKSTDLIVE